MLKHVWRRYGINPLDRLLKKAKKQKQTRFLICWNRGLGDIPLGLYALTERIRSFIPAAQITFATRPDLVEGFKMLPSVTAIVDPEWKRGSKGDVDAMLSKNHLTRLHFDVILEQPDPARWLVWQVGTLTPRLFWDPAWDQLCQRFPFSSERTYVGVHVQTETHYAYEKNWPLEYFRALFHRLLGKDVHVILFGFNPIPAFEGQHIYDLRGKTTLLEMLSIVKNQCRFLLVPDSGILSMTYYIDALFPIKVLSLWADPKQGVLKQRVSSPNVELIHHPFIAKNQDLRTISVDQVIEALC